MGPTWVLLAPDGPYVGPMNLAIKAVALDRGIFQRGTHQQWWKRSVQHISNWAMAILHYSDITWGSWHLISLATQLFVHLQPAILISGPLREESTDGFLSQRDIDEESVFMSWYYHESLHVMLLILQTCSNEGASVLPLLIPVYFIVHLMICLFNIYWNTENRSILILCSF